MISRDPQVANRVAASAGRSLLVGAGTDSGGMGIRPYTVAGISGAAYGLYVGDQVLDNYGNGYVVWSNGTQSYVRGNNITMYAGDDVNDSTWVQLQGGVTPQIRIAANYNEGFIMNSNGKVRLPYQPAFMAHRTAGISVSNGATMPFNYASINRGSHYNTSTYRFTAPVAGVYVFGGMIRIDADQPYIHSHVKVNNTISPYQGELPGLIGSGGSGLGFTANGALAYMRNMSAGDYIEFPVYWYSGGPYTLHQQSFVFGYLLG